VSRASGPDGSVDAAVPGAPVRPRVLAVVFALFWAVLFFGVIDLLVVVIQDEVFYEHYIVEAGWGLLYTVLVPVPLIAWAVRPQWLVLAQQVVAAGGAVLMMGVIALVFGQVFVGVVLFSAGLALWLSTGRPLWPPPGLSLRGANRRLLALVGLSAVAAAVYAWRMLDAAHTGQSDDDTWGLMHLPMQAAFGVALAASAALAVLAGAAGARGWRFAILPAAVSAAWFGAVCVAYPDHVGSIGKVGGVAAICWGLALAALAWGTETARAGPRPPTRDADSSA
jgi:hypothetical protein